MTSLALRRAPALLPLLLCLPLACADDGGEDGDGDTFGDFDSSDSLDEVGTEADTETGDSADTTTTGDGDTTGSTDTGSTDTTGDGDTGSTDTTTGDGDTGSTDTTGDGDTGSTDTTGDGDTTTTTTTTGDMCTQCNVTLNSTQSSSFVALPGTEFMGYATLQDTEIIYALDEVGPGRVIYTADTNLLYGEITDCPLWEWLGQSGMQLPKVLSFGRYLCDGLGNNLGSYPDLTYAGDNLPAQYVGNPEQLAADYDAVIYCTLASTPAAEAQTIVDYVQNQGGGLYLASEYWGFINQGDLDAVNAIANPLGVEFEATNLDWGQANGEIDFACFPPPQ